MKAYSCPLPEGIELPDEAQKGASFDLVASGKIVDGNFVIEAFDGVPLEGTSKEEAGEPSEPGEPKPKKKSFMDAVEEKFNPTPPEA